MAVNVAEKPEELSQTLIEYGADIVYEYASPDYAQYMTEPYAQAAAMQSDTSQKSCFWRNFNRKRYCTAYL